MGHDYLRDTRPPISREWNPFPLERRPSGWVSRILKFQSRTFQLIPNVFLCVIIQQIPITRNGRPEDVLGFRALLYVNLINQGGGLWIPFNIITDSALP